MERLHKSSLGYLNVIPQNDVRIILQAYQFGCYCFQRNTGINIQIDIIFYFFKSLKIEKIKWCQNIQTNAAYHPI